MSFQGRLFMTAHNPRVLERASKFLVSRTHEQGRPSQLILRNDDWRLFVYIGHTRPRISPMLSLRLHDTGTDTGDTSKKK